MSKTAGYTKILKILDLIDSYDLFLFDLWGVIIQGHKSCYPGAVELLNKISQRKNIMFVSNSSRTSLWIYEELRSYGIDLTIDMVVTAGELAKNVLLTPENYFDISHPIVYNFGHSHHEELWNNPKIQVTQDIIKANLMIIGFSSPDGKIDSSQNSVLCQAASLNIPAICVNNDRISVIDNNILYCPGYFARKYEELGGKVFFIGKPFAPIFQEAIKSHPSIDRPRILMVGDTLENDILGANNFNIASALVTTGNIALELAGKKDEKQLLATIQAICDKTNIHPNHIVSL